MSNLIIFPAIDIMGGKVVRLKQGHFDEVTKYSEDPLVVAKHWVSVGAEWIHVVDLDGAKTGEMKNMDVIKNIAKGIKIPIQVGGGVRSADRLKELIEEAGVQRVILGTRAIGDEYLLNEAISKWPTQVAVSIDCSQGMVTTRGWMEVTQVKGMDLAKKLEAQGIQCIIYTDIQRDGMLQGPNIPRVTEILKAVQIKVIASGGIADMTDIVSLCELREKHPNLLGGITGKALYENKLDFAQALKMRADYKNYRNMDM